MCLNYPAKIVAYFQEKQIEVEGNYATQQDSASNFGNVVDPRATLKFLLCKNRLTLLSSLNEIFLHEIAKLKPIAIFSGIDLN